MIKMDLTKRPLNHNGGENWRCPGGFEPAFGVPIKMEMNINGEREGSKDVKAWEMSTMGMLGMMPIKRKMMMEEDFGNENRNAQTY